MIEPTINRNSMSLYSFGSSRLTEIKMETMSNLKIRERQDLQDVLGTNIEAVAPDVLLVEKIPPLPDDDPEGALWMNQPRRAMLWHMISIWRSMWILTASGFSRRMFSVGC